MQHQFQSPSIPLLLHHGLLSSPQEFGLLAHALRSKGIVHHALQIPGDTGATDQRTFDWHAWRQASLEEAAAVTTDAPLHPVALGGLWMGGILAAACALAAPQWVAGLVLMSPTFAYDGWAMSPVQHLRYLGYWTRLDRFFSVAERPPFGVENEKIRKWIIRELPQRAVSAAGRARVLLRALRQAEHMMAHVLSRLATLSCPLLVIDARDDEITSLRSVRRVFDVWPLLDKRLEVLHNSYHIISIDNDRQRVASLLAGFVRRLTPVPQPVPTAPPMASFLQALRASPMAAVSRAHLGHAIGTDAALP